MRLKYCLPQLGFELQRSVCRRHIGFSQLQPISRGIRRRRVSFYLDFYLIIIIIVIPFFSLYFFHCINPFQSSYSSSLSPHTPDFRLFPAYLLLFHFFITAHIFPSISSTTFIIFLFPLSFIHCLYPLFYLELFSLAVFLIYLYIRTSISSPIPPYVLPNSLFTFFPLYLL